MKGVKLRDVADLRFSNRMAVWTREGLNGGRAGKEREREKWTIFSGKEQGNCDVPV